MNRPEIDITKIAIQALKLESELQRNIYLDQVCRNQDVRKHVIALLNEPETMAGDLLKDQLEKEQPSESDNPADSDVGTKIGSYHLTQEIGRGGFGVVYWSRQTEPIVRDVALKLIKRGMDTKEVLKRFENERQTLAILNHPSIASILDAGKTEDHRPYFVMELVQGLPINQYCSRQKLNTFQRIQLFCKVCRAVSFAHQNGVIHRDLKPSNILVELRNQSANPKIIDFGISKVIDDQTAVESIYTGVDVIVGSPPYMSPEQAAQNDRSIDARSDIYSLGVILFELLTGEAPFDPKELKERGIEELLRVIREVDIPAPSRYIQTTTSYSQSTIHIANRNQDRVSTDLDWIVQKATSKDPNQRYETVRDLEKDLNRFLVGMPIEARPPSTFYKMKRFVQRNKVAFFSGLAISLTLIFSTVFSAMMAIDALHQKTVAEDLAKNANHQKSIAQQATTEAEKAWKWEKAKRKTLEGVVDFLRDILADSNRKSGSQNLTLRKLFKTRRIEFQSHLPNDIEARAIVLEMFALVQKDSGEYPLALEAFREAVDLHRKVETSNPENLHRIVVQYAQTLLSLGLDEEAGPMLRKIIHYYREHPDHDENKLWTMTLLTKQEILNQNIQEATYWNNRCLNTLSDDGAFAPILRDVRKNQASLLTLNGKHLAAISLRKTLLNDIGLDSGPNSIQTLQATKELIGTLLAGNENRQALSYSKLAIQISKNLYRENEYGNLSTLSLHAEVLNRNNQLEPAIDYAKNVCRMADVKYGPDFIQCLRWKNQYTTFLFENGNHLETIGELNLAMSNLGKLSKAKYRVEDQLRIRLTKCSRILSSRKTTYDERKAMAKASRFIQRPEQAVNVKYFPKHLNSYSKSSNNLVSRKGLPYSSRSDDQKTPDP